MSANANEARVTFLQRVKLAEEMARNPDWHRVVRRDEKGRPLQVSVNSPNACYCVSLFRKTVDGVFTIEAYCRDIEKACMGQAGHPTACKHTMAAVLVASGGRMRFYKVRRSAVRYCEKHEGVIPVHIVNRNRRKNRGGVWGVFDPSEITTV